MGLGFDSVGAVPSGTGTSSHAPSFVPPTPEALAAQFPQLEILEFVGSGDMGAVYKARQPHLDRIVALKILPPEIAADPTFAERFTREARAMAKLFHPHIVLVFDFGAAGGIPYLVMEFVDGVNLRHAIQAGELQPEQAVAIVPQICDALQYAHDMGVVHRDIKPENILLDRGGHVKIADFGLVKLLGPGAAEFTLTGTRQLMGTPHYMAPEQMDRPQEVDHRADIYALGVVFYEMLTGELPLGRFAPPSEKAAIDTRLDDVVHKTLENEPNRRYQQASEVRTDVDRITNESPQPATRATNTTLLQVFRDWWRDWRGSWQQLLTNVAKWSAFAAYVGFFYQLVNVTRSTHENGYVHRVGEWMTMSRHLQTGFQFQSEYHIFDERFGVYFCFGLLAYYIYWRIKKTETGSSEWFRFPRDHVILWLSMVGYGFLGGVGGVDGNFLRIPTWAIIIIGVTIVQLVRAFARRKFPLLHRHDEKTDSSL
jgi:tRNA A-37 threonylcarbamoyl transferase component Bud32